jgi:EmrB/QacA subfamily drug resistance transporter
VAAAQSATSKRWTLVATIIASSMTFIDGTVVNVALPGLQAGLGATITEVQWVIEAYALFLGALILVGGSLGDQLGRKRVFLFGVVSFAGASALCGFAPTALLLIVGRALQGIGAAFLVPGSLAIITATFDDKERGAAIGTWSGFSAITTAIGPVLGGWLVEHVSWRAVFFINLPLAAFVLVLSLRYVEESRDDSRHGKTDVVGAALTVVGLSGLVLGLLEWPPLGLTHPLVLASLVAGVVCLIALPFVEHRRESPMLPLALFKSRTFSLANVLTIVLYAALSVMMFLVPLNLIQVQGYSATAAGASLLPFPIIMFALSRWSGGLVARVGARIPLTAGPAVAALALFAFARAGIGGSFWTTFFPGIVILGLGMSITVAPLTTTVMNAADRTHSGAASGVNNAVSRVGGLLAIAVFGVMLSRSFDAQMETKLSRIPLSAEARTGVARELPKMAGAELNAVSSLSEDQRKRVRTAVNESFADAFRLAMIVAAVLALIAAAVGFAIV